LNAATNRGEPETSPAERHAWKSATAATTHAQAFCPKIPDLTAWLRLRKGFKPRNTRNTRKKWNTFAYFAYFAVLSPFYFDDVFESSPGSSNP
jgi:hypothetical protein